MTIAFGLLLLLAGAGSAAVVLLDDRIHGLPLPAQAVYLIPSAYLAVIGIGLLLRHRAAYEAAKGFGVAVVALTGGIAAISGLFTMLVTHRLLPLTEFAAVVGIPFVLAIGVRAYARRTALVQRFWREWDFPPPRAIFALAIVAGVLSMFLWKDAATGLRVAATLEPYSLQHNVARETPPTLPRGVQPVPRDSTLASAAPANLQTTGDSVTRVQGGEVFWLDYTNRPANLGTSRGQFWNPATGALRTVDLPVHIPALAAIAALPSGLLFVGGQTGLREAYLAGEKPTEPKAEATLFLVTPENKVITGKLHVARGSVHVLAISDSAVLVVGGTVAWKRPQAYEQREPTRTTAVERVTLKDGKLIAEKLPDVPGGVNRGYTLVALDSHRVMLLGGTDSRLLGCWNCSAATYILDLKAGTWSAGPKMTEPRAYAGAALLPDGSALVAGGWTPSQDWQQGPTRTTERWDPRTNAFTPGPSLIAGAAKLRPLWVPGQEGKQLLMAGGTSSAVQVYDVANNRVRRAGEFAFTQEFVGQVPVVYRGDAYLWMIASTQPFLVKLRPTVAQTAPGPAADFDDKIYRHRITLLPGKDDAPALALGGWNRGASTQYEPSAEVTAIWPDGRIQPLAPLNETRDQGHAFRLPDGSALIVGGSQYEGDQPEWMNATANPDEAKWVTLDANIPDDSLDSLTLLADGSLIWADANGSIKRLKISAGPGGTPVAKTEDFPALDLHGDYTLKGLPDGRVIALGATRATEYVALLPPGPDQDNNNARDTYVPMGEESPVDFYQIYDPQKKAWHHSAPLDDNDSDQVAILDDGRVASYDNDGIAISTPDGTAWHGLPESGRLQCLQGRGTRLFTQDNELFLAGCDIGTNASTVQWFDFAGHRWTTIWQHPASDESDNSVRGYVISRQLPNGKRVTLPVQDPDS